MVLSYVINGVTRGFDYSKYFFIQSLFFYGFLLLYLSFSLSKFEIVRGYTAPFSYSFKHLIPKVKKYSDHSGTELIISASRNFPFIPDFDYIKNQLPIKVFLQKRIVIDDNLECYLAKLEKAIYIDGYVEDRVIIMPKLDTKKLNQPGNMLVHFILIPSHEILEKPVLTLANFEFAGWAVSKRLSV